MSTDSMTDRDEMRIKSCADALAALERIHGTRALCQGIERFEKDEDFGERRWAAMPERRARMEEYARVIAEADGRECPELTRPVTATPFPPVEETRLYKLAQEVANEPLVDGRKFNIGDRVTVLPVEPCALCGETLEVRTGTVLRQAGDTCENRYPVQLDDEVGVHLFGDGRQRCGTTTRVAHFEEAELATECDNQAGH